MRSIPPPLLLFLPLASLACPATEREQPQAAASTPRLASFSPALTDMLFEMDLGEQVVGVTRYCSLPAGEQRPALGDAIALSAEAVLAVQPDVLLIQSDPQRFAPLKQLDPQLKVEHFSIETLADISAAMRRVAAIAGRPDAGERAGGRFEEGLQELRARAADLPKTRALFVTGFEKPGTAGSGTFVHELIELLGGVNAAEQYQGWANLNLEYVLAAQPEVLICWTDPAQAEQARSRWQSLEDLPAARAGRVHVVTDPSWTLPTSALLQRAAELAIMLHPQLAEDKGG